MRKLRWLVIVLAGALWAGPAAAHDAEIHPAVLLVDASTGAVLEAENATHLWHPASLTKVMTAYLVFEALARGWLKIDQKVPVSKHAVAQPPTKLGLGVGKEVSVELLLEAMIVRSANDAAVVLAEAVSGSEAAFAAAMTQKARVLGMSQSRFLNASGLPNREQVTTARDMIILARALIAKFPDRFEFFSLKQFTLGKRTRPTLNGWMRGYTGAEGIKTGFTCGSGYNLLGSAKRGDRRLIGVVLGATSSGMRNGRMTKLMNAGFAKATPAAAGARLLDALPKAKSQTVPYVLPDDTCAKSPGLANGHLPGWGVVFGSFPSKAKANQTIERNRKALKSIARSGRSVVLPKDRWGRKRYTAVLVGLKQTDAGRACDRLRDLGLYCQSIPPRQLNNPKALWR